MSELADGADAAADVLTGVVASLAALDQRVGDAARIDRIRLLEAVKSAASAAQARETTAFADSQRAAQLAAGAPADRASRGVAAQVALARRISPHRAQRELGWARILTGELPATFAALQAGRTSEWRAMIVARETAWLSREHRAQVDAELAAELATLGDRRVEARVKTIAYRLDAAGYVDRLRTAAGDRRVSLRPGPDTMSRLTVLTPVAHGVAAYAALSRAADTARGRGDPRSRGQVMADLLIERVTGQTAADAVPVELNLIMSDQTLLNAGHRRDEPGVLIGYGPIPAPIARDLALKADGAPRWLRRLYTAPGSGQLAAMESRRRLFTPAQQRFVLLRDQLCRTPYCDAPIRHTDHVQPAVDDGPTAVHNAQGCCVACNHAKQASGWHARTDSGGAAGGDIHITTPTGHHYQSRPPDPPTTAAPARRRQRPPAAARSPFERAIIDWLFPAA